MTVVPHVYDYINSIDCKISLCTLNPTAPETETVMSSAPNIRYLFTR